MVPLSVRQGSWTRYPEHNAGSQGNCGSWAGLRGMHGSFLTASKLLREALLTVSGRTASGLTAGGWSAGMRAAANLEERAARHHCMGRVAQAAEAVLSDFKAEELQAFCMKLRWQQSCHEECCDICRYLLPAVVLISKDRRDQLAGLRHYESAAHTDADSAGLHCGAFCLALLPLPFSCCLYLFARLLLLLLQYWIALCYQQRNRPAMLEATEHFECRRKGVPAQEIRLLEGATLSLFDAPALHIPRSPGGCLALTSSRALQLGLCAMLSGHMRRVLWASLT